MYSLYHSFAISSVRIAHLTSDDRPHVQRWNGLPLRPPINRVSGDFVTGQRDEKIDEVN